MSEIIEIVLLNKKTNVATIKLVRSISSLFSISEINNRIRMGAAIYTRELKKEEFYTGIDEVLSVVDLFVKNNIDIKINANGSEIDRTNLLAIKDKISHVSLEDFR